MNNVGHIRNGIVLLRERSTVVAVLFARLFFFIILISIVGVGPSTRAIGV